MMPLGIPKVPYRMPGSQQADWVDIYNRMYRERIIFLGETIDDQIVNQIIAVMLFADSEAAQQVESAALLARQLAAPGRLGPPGLRLGPPCAPRWNASAVQTPVAAHGVASSLRRRRRCPASQLPAPSLTRNPSRRAGREEAAVPVHQLAGRLGDGRPRPLRHDGPRELRCHHGQCGRSGLKVPPWRFHSTLSRRPGAAFPGTRLRCGLGASHRAAQGPMRGCRPAVRPGRSAPKSPKPPNVVAFDTQVGMAASMGSFILGAGTRGKRIALPHSKTMIHQPMGGARGQAEDIRVQVRLGLGLGLGLGLELGLGSGLGLRLGFGEYLPAS